MKIEIKYVICSFLFVLGWSILNAQVTGFQGRRMVVKTDLMPYLLDGGYNLETEIAILRRLSIGVGYRKFHRQVRQPVLNNGSSSSYPDATRVYGFMHGEKGDIRGKEYVGTIKLYFRSAFCAPKGTYLYGYHARGRAEVEGEYTEIGYDPFTGAEGHILKSYRLGNLTTTRQGVGLGNQWVFYNRITLDVSAGIELNYLGKWAYDESDWFRQSIDQTYGASLLNESDFSVSNFQENRGNGGDLSNYGLWGIAAALKLGVLIF